MSNIFITLDYELFFGRDTGTQKNSIIYPTERLLEILDKHKVKASFFVDSGYLLKLKEYKREFSVLENDYKKISEQLKSLALQGHDLQLHIHPHWEDSFFNGESWIMDTTRYRLNAFSQKEINSIVTRYKKVIEEFSQNEVFAFRAGGWCIQPFEKLKPALKFNNIWLDSTVFKNGKNKSKTHFFDFKGAPDKVLWKFEDDPIKEDPNGFFTEIPISSFKVSPRFFWNLVFTKKIGGPFHESFGDGAAAGGSIWDKVKMLTRHSNTVVSIDGYKSSLLNKAFAKFQEKADNKNFVIIGHPKALSEYSIQKLDYFLETTSAHNFATYRSWAQKSDHH